MSQSDVQKRTLGVTFSTDRRATIVVWAPTASEVAISINDYSILLPLASDGDGYWQLTTDRLKPGDHYTFLLDNQKERADPASRHQPQGADGPSQAFDTNSVYWEDSSWINPPVDEYIVYEIDIRAFTPEGTLQAIAGKLSHLKELGITTILIRPVAPCSGFTNQGQATASLFAVEASFGGPDQLQYVINACHYEGLAVMLDLPYGYRPTTASDGGTSGAAYHQYYTQNALMWFRDFHVDALLLNGIHSLPDNDRLLRDIRIQTNTLTTRTGHQYYLLTEQDLTLVSTRVHLAEHPNPLTTTDRLRSTGGNGKAHQQGFEQNQQPQPQSDCLCDSVFSGILQELFGREADPVADQTFMAMLQAYHKSGDNSSANPLDAGVDRELLKLLAGAVMVSPCVPTLFMGEEWGVTSPFQRLTQHEQVLTDSYAALAEAGETREPTAVLPWENLAEPSSQTLYQYYQALTTLRRHHPALYQLNPNQISIHDKQGDHTVLLHRWHKTDHVVCLMNFCADKQPVTVPALGQPLQKLLDSADPAWDGPGASPESLPDASHLTLQPTSIVVYTTRK